MIHIYVVWNVWRKAAGLPEVWDMGFRQATSMQYPLRPGQYKTVMELLAKYI